MKTVIVDERLQPECKSELLRLGFCIIPLPRSERLPEAVCSHTDILTFAVDNRIILSEEYARENQALLIKLKSELKDIDIRLAHDSFSKEYPKDAVFNALVMGKYVFCKADTVSREVLQYAKDMQMRIVNVNQGYPACTVLKLSDSIAVTADDGMERALSEKGISVYKIANSEKIMLPPYPYGFIGGTAGIFGKSIYFAGDLQLHPDCDIIEAAAFAAGLKCVSLAKDVPLLDVGRLVFYD